MNQVRDALKRLFRQTIPRILSMIEPASPAYKTKAKQAITVVVAFAILNLACQAAAHLFIPTTPTLQSPIAINSPTRSSPSTPIQPAKTNTPLPSPTPNHTPTQKAESLGCEGILAFRFIDPPEQTRDLFEHHAQGTFLFFHLEAINLTQNSIQIYSDDYTLILPAENDTSLVKPHKAATNYLYLVRGDNFYQDKIKPNAIWHTYLAFDVPPQTKEWKLLLTPGSGNSPPLCQTTLSP